VDRIPIHFCIGSRRSSDKGSDDSADKGSKGSADGGSDEIQTKAPMNGRMWLAAFKDTSRSFLSNLSFALVIGLS
jgi:hypothetical protein